MIITYHGCGAIKVVFGGTTLGFNPVSKDSKEKATRFGADVALVSLAHPDYNGVESLSFGTKEPFVVSGPGEYEVSGVTIKGVPSVSSYDGTTHNTIYRVSLEGMTLCHLGALSTHELSGEVRGALDGIDVLFVPIGGEGVLSAAEAHKVAVSIAPALIVPVHTTPESLKAFLKESGSEKNTPLDKLTLKKKDLEGKEGEVVVLGIQ